MVMVDMQEYLESVDPSNYEKVLSCFVEEFENYLFQQNVHIVSLCKNYDKGERYFEKVFLPEVRDVCPVVNTEDTDLPGVLYHWEYSSFAAGDFIEAERRARITGRYFARSICRQNLILKNTTEKVLVTAFAKSFGLDKYNEKLIYRSSGKDSKVRLTVEQGHFQTIFYFDILFDVVNF
jgi:hypothetical protein